MSGIICSECGRDIDALGQDNMSCTSEPLCEDCWSVAQSHTVDALKREVRSLRLENARLREKLDARAEDGARPKATKFATCGQVRRSIERAYAASRERALALTRLDECELWLGRCEPRETAAPAAAGAPQDAAMPCSEDASVELRPDALADAAGKRLCESAQQTMRIAVE